jgi:hypothetical protein
MESATEGTIFYLTTRIATSLGQFRTTAGIASFTALPLCFKRSPHPLFKRTGTAVKIRFSPNTLKDGPENVFLWLANTLYIKGV